MQYATKILWSDKNLLLLHGNVKLTANGANMVCDGKMFKEVSTCGTCLEKSCILGVDEVLDDFEVEVVEKKPIPLWARRHSLI